MSEHLQEASKAAPVKNIPLLSSIRFKAWTGVFLLTIIPLISFGLYAFHSLAGVSGNLLIESNIQAFQQVKYEVDQYVQNYEDLARFLANDIRLSLPDQAPLSLQQLDQSYEYIDRIVLCGENGELKAHSKPDHSAISSLTVPETLLLSSARNIFFSPEAFHVKATVAHSESDAIIVTISFLKLRKSLEGITFGTNFDYYLVTNEGENILDQPDFPAELISDLMKRPCGAYNILPTRNNFQPQLAISMPILQYGLRIFVFQSAGEVYAITKAIGDRTVNFVLLLAVVAFLFATWFSIKLTEPVIAIAEKANELSAGNLSVKVDASRNDELGFLGSCFNNMTQRIHDKVFELSAMYRVTQVINTSPTYQQALDDCLSHIIEIFQAQRGSIMLLNEDRTKLLVESFRQAGQIDSEAKSEARERFALEVGEGIAGEVAQAGRPILCMDCSQDERFKNYDDSAGRKAPKTLISVPLSVHGTTMGVINLSDRSDSTAFSNEDLVLLMAIANQMAMSIDNARLHELSITDDLTELYIKRFFQIRLEDEIKRARRFSFPLTLVMFELDNFRELDARHGTKISELMLYEVAQILKDSVRATDIPCRYDQYVFAVILAHTSAEQALIFAERLRERIAAFSINRADNEIKSTISSGITQHSDKHESGDALIKMANRAMITSRDAGKNRTTTLGNEEKKA